MASKYSKHSTRRFIPREGLYLDPICSLISWTLLNPILIATFLFVFRQFQRGDLFVIVSERRYQENIFYWMKLLGFIGGLFWVNQFLNWAANNNFIRAKPWDSKQELVLITGGSGGIGASVARRLAREGNRVVILDILPLAFPERENIIYYKCDLSDLDEINHVMARVREECGPPTVLVNNAGISRGSTIADGLYHDNNLTLKINLLAAFIVTKECLPYMIANNHGHIISISSMSAFIPPAGLADYSASKAGLVAFNEALGLELRYRHRVPAVRNSLLVLSFTKTPLFVGETNQNAFVSPLLHVDTVGDEVVNTIYGGYSRTIFMPGILRYLGWIRGAPDWVQHLIRRSTEGLKVDFRGRQVIDSATGKLKI
ncbi:hypothetical protein B0O99DRAFT_508058 [Bisporella sp. PMI_857]|nr:hypothetical protein B0O99DRAFT_508058 [Bisporella sp. PMI_857]